ncbi:hypothetical protein RAS1_12310 [Phycisphaerae bacterium RAS1]|nr:hypothetical protein RAS1_12310 [Phycisphaerae bacterium RAS1]
MSRGLAAGTCAARAALVLLAAAAIGPLSGCAWLSYVGTDDRGVALGKTFYIGGAGYLGNVGDIDVPKGLRRGGWRGAIEVIGWQSVIGGALRDQLDRERNLEQAQRVARRILNYVERYPGRPVNLIALSAGTGIATWALESLPEHVRVQNVVFFGSSLSRRYDLREALTRVDGKLYNFHSSRDPVLKVGVPLAGSVDREFATAAGLNGFAPPSGTDARGLRVYGDKLRNMPYRSEYARSGYHGLHTDATHARFVRKYVAPLIARVWRQPAASDGPQPASQPASAPRAD